MAFTDKVNVLERALLMAVAAHSGRTDKAGYPEILHPLSVLNSVRYESDEVKAAAILHDTVEDGLLPMMTVRESFPNRVAELVDLLTRKVDPSGNKEPYEQYVRRAAKDPDARKIKRADVVENLTRRSPDELKGYLAKKYATALKILDEHNTT